MSKVSVEIGMTIQVRERDFYKLTLGISDIDTELDVGAQLAAAGKHMGAVYETLSATIAQKVEQDTGYKLVKV